jgi:hypothetical protein
MLATATRRIPSATRACSPEEGPTGLRDAVAFNRTGKNSPRATRAFAILAQVEFGARYSYLKREPYL